MRSSQRAYEPAKSDRLSAHVKTTIGYHLAAITLALTAASPTVAAEQVGPHEWTGVRRLVVFGDIHGSYDKLVALLQGTETVDGELKWVASDTHVVFCGDLTDRGPNERPVLDLVRRLETEAEVAGGRVHVVLGNHEVINMVGDLRYVEGNGYADFAGDEEAADRQAALERFRSEASKSGITGRQVLEAFDEHFPRGYFGRLRAFDANGEYGAWLLGKPSVVKVNGYVFLHGGLRDEVAASGLDAINQEVSDAIRRYLDNRATISDGEILNYKETQALAAQLADDRSVQRRSPARAAAAQALLAHYDDLPFSPGGPLWYRGNSVENERLERASLDAALASLNADGIVVAHTPTGSGQITSRFNGKVHRSDVGMAYGRQPLCLVFQGGQIAVFNPRDGEYSVPLLELPQGERFSDIDEQLPDKQIERFLSKAPVVSTSYREVDQEGEARHAEIWLLENKNMELRALFQDVDEAPSGDGSTAARRWTHEIAAYKLDRMMELGYVPVAVKRQHDGKVGSLQMWIHSAIDLKQIEEYGRREILEQLRDEIIQARIFSALMGARLEDRHKAGRMILPKEGRVLAMDNTKAFSTSTDVEGIIFGEVEVLAVDECRVEEHFELKMRQLQRGPLLKELGDYLSAAQIDALLARRDRLLELCGD